MPDGTENELLTQLRAPSRTVEPPGALRFLLDTMVAGPAPAEIAFSALRLQVALRCQTSARTRRRAVLAPTGSRQYRNPDPL